jgi:hypothetical protein
MNNIYTVAMAGMADLLQVIADIHVLNPHNVMKCSQLSGDTGSSADASEYPCERLE